MPLQSTKQTSNFSDDEQPGNGAFYLVSRLLTEVLAGKDETVEIKAKAESVFYDPETKIQATGSFGVQIISADLAESGINTEVSMSGVAETHCAVRHSFTLYFLLKRTVAVIPKKVIRMENLSGASFVMGFEKLSEILYDSLFELSINRIEATGKHYELGKGRGFLVFGNGECIVGN